MLSLKGMRRLFVPALVTVSPKSKENRGAHKTDNILTKVYDLQSGRRLELEYIIETRKLPPSGERRDAVQPAEGRAETAISSIVS